MISAIFYRLDNGNSADIVTLDTRSVNLKYFIKIKERYNRS